MIYSNWKTKASLRNLMEIFQEFGFRLTAYKVQMWWTHMVRSTPLEMTNSHKMCWLIWHDINLGEGVL